MLKKYFQKTTLFTVLAILLLTIFVIVAISRQPEEIKSSLLANLAVSFLILVVVDVLMKQLLKTKTGLLWILQIFLVLIAFYVWIVKE